MDLKVNSGPPSLTAQTLFHHAPPPPCSLASSFSARLQALSPAQALGAPSLNLASDSTDFPPNEDLASHPLGASTPAPAQRASSRAGASAPGPQGPAWQPRRAGGPRRARRGPTATPRASPQPHTRPLCPSKCPAQANCI